MQNRHLNPLCLASLLAVAATACGAEPAAGRKASDSVEDPTQPGPGDDGSGGGESQTPGTGLISQAVACEEPQTARPPLRRLSRLEYKNSVRDLFAAEPGAANNVSDAKIAGFNSNSAVPLSETGAEAYSRAAEQIATQAISNLTNLSSCSSASDADCVKAFLSQTAKRAYRGALDSDDIAAIHQLYDEISAESDAQTGLELAIQSILLSPKFLYVIEFGAGDAGVVPLTQAEVASRLALGIWRSLPDDVLLAKAEAGELSSPEAVVAEANRMLDDERARSAFTDFIQQYLEVDHFAGVTKVETQYPQFEALKPQFEQETLRFFQHVVRSGDLDALLNAPFTIANQALASYYGAAPPASPDADGYGIVDLPAERRGILMQGSVLSEHAHPAKTSPVKIGKLVRQQVLCDPPPPPPPGVEVDVEVKPGETARAAFDQHSADPKCVSCHALMDPIGHGFNAFDAAGAYVGGDASGNIVAPRGSGSADISGEFSGAAELAGMLASSEHVAQCYTLQVFRYILGRAESDADACALKSAYERFAESNHTLREAILGSVASSAFLLRPRVNAGGSCQ